MEKTSSWAYETGVIAGKGAAAGLLRVTADEYEQQFGAQNRTAAVLIHAATLIEESAKDGRGLHAADFTRASAIEYFTAAAQNGFHERREVILAAFRALGVGPSEVGEE